MCNQLEIRSASNSDHTQLIKILMSTFANTWEPQLTETGLKKAANIADRMATYVSTYGRDFVVAELDGELVGMVHWYDNFIEALHVSESAQGNGVGGQLLDKALIAISQDYEESRLETDTFNLQARGFYKKHGFEEVATYPDEEWDSGFTTVEMVKPLKQKS